MASKRGRLRDTGPTIIVYTKPDCADCFNAKRYLTNRDIPFDIRDISEEGVIDELLDLLGPGDYSTPIIAAGDRVFAGFAGNREELERVLDQMRL
jgi:glutaredoxin